MNIKKIIETAADKIERLNAKSVDDRFEQGRVYAKMKSDLSKTPGGNLNDKKDGWKQAFASERFPHNRQNADKLIFNATYFDSIQSALRESTLKLPANYQLLYVIFKQFETEPELIAKHITARTTRKTFNKTLIKMGRKDPPKPRKAREDPRVEMDALPNFDNKMLAELPDAIDDSSNLDINILIESIGAMIDHHAAEIAKAGGLEKLKLAYAHVRLEHDKRNKRKPASRRKKGATVTYDEKSESGTVRFN